VSKIICEICGTTYPETASHCPICGCSKDAAAEFLGGETFLEEPAVVLKAKGGQFTPKKKKEIFDFDEANSMPEDETVEENNPYTEEEDEPVYEEKRGGNVFAVIILTILIVVLLAAAGFIFVRYFLPSIQADAETEPVIVTEAIQATQAPTTELRIPCQMLILSSGTAELTEEGQMFLLHVQPSPEDTTDTITYISADQSIATVTADGKVTAVSEGETMIYISCGDIQTTCPVIVAYVEETVPETTVSEEVVAIETGSTEAEPTETEPTETEATEPALRTDVTLKLKQTDIRLGVYYEYQLLLDCDLAQNDVEWRSEHPHIAKVNEEGVITAIKDGTTSIIAKYGDQEVSCIVRCNY
jgi:hypothetical protein